MSLISSFDFFHHWFGSPYLKTGILAECGTERTLSDSIMEKKVALEDILEQQRQFYTERRRERGRHSVQSFVYSAICSMNGYSKCINPINPALSN